MLPFWYIVTAVLLAVQVLYCVLSKHPRWFRITTGISLILVAVSTGLWGYEQSHQALTFSGTTLAHVQSFAWIIGLAIFVVTSMMSMSHHVRLQAHQSVQSAATPTKETSLDRLEAEFDKP